ncbi:hypothetical protein DW901_13605 [Firmicutes bacterium AM41-5BH]|nr:hypothetical protein DW901_13605 [Firmicutes bacterium AM41-5BH]
MGAEKMKICPVCGKQFKPWKRQVYCDKNCATIARLQRNKKKREVKQIQKAKCSISDVAAEAKRHGMSYGYFVGLMWLKKIGKVDVSG